jgi:adenylylsulfate kinase
MTGVGFWFTGLPGSGKSTIARILEERLLRMGQLVQNLDAEEWRAYVSPDLGFSRDDRDLNTARLAYVQSLLTRNGVHAIVAAVSALRFFRDRARRMNEKFVEVYVQCSFQECRRRDPKGIYARGERGEVRDIAGWHQPYEIPDRPELILPTEAISADRCADLVIQRAIDLGFLTPSPSGVDVGGR